MPERDFRIDLLRSFACVMVLSCHSPQVYQGQSGAFLVGVNNYFGMAWGPILFFAITGICTLNKVQEALPFFRRRFARIFIPTVVWSIVYICLQCFVWNTSSQAEFFNMLIGILVKPQYGIFWFMYALVSIYLMVPILSQWFNQCRPNEIKLYLFLWGGDFVCHT